MAERRRLGATASALAIVMLGTSTAIIASGQQVQPGISALGEAVDVSPEHAVADRVVIPNVGDQDEPAVASDGDGFLAVWRDERRDGIRGTRVSADGKVLDPDEITISAHGAVGDPAVSWDGKNYLVVWSRANLGGASRSDIYGARVSPDGVVLDSDPVPISTEPHHQVAPAVTFNGTHHLVVWADWRGGDDTDIYAARVDQAANVLDAGGRPLEVAPGYQHRPAVASDGDGFLALWSDNPGVGSDIRGARVSAAGTVVDADPLTLSAASGSQTSPAVVWDGTRYFAAWTEYSDGDSDVVGVPVTNAGDVEGPEVDLATGPGSQAKPALVRNGSSVLLAWGQSPVDWPPPGSPNPLEVFAARVVEGVRAGPPVRVGPGATPSAGFNGRMNLIASSMSLKVPPPANPPQGDVYAVRLSAEGAVHDDPAILLTGQANWQTEAAVAWNGESYLVSWWDWRPDGTRAFARVSATGEPLDGSGVLLPGGSQVPVAAASNGDGFLLVWPSHGGRLRGVRIGADGRPVDPSPFEVDPGAGKRAMNRVAVASDGQDYFVVWDQRDQNNDFALEIVGTRIPALGPVSDSPPVRISSGEGHDPAVAWTGESFLVAWFPLEGAVTRGRPGAGVLAARVAVDGEVLPGPPIFVGSQDTLEYRNLTVVASPGMALIAWDGFPESHSGPMTTYGVRVDARGRMLDRSPLSLVRRSLSFDGVAAAWSGTHFLLTWVVGGHTSRDLRAARIDPSGDTVDPDGFVVASSTDAEYDQAVVGVGSGRSAVVYTRDASEAAYNEAARVFLRFVDD